MSCTAFNPIEQFGTQTHRTMSSSSSSSSEKVENQHYEKPDIRGDWLNFLLLTFLYVLQGAVLGVAIAIPLVLQKRNITYKEQAEYNIVGYSFSFKILWAPIVDSIYWKKLGRRKSWLVPMQYLIGVLLLIISMNIDSLLGTEDGTRKPNVRLLTIIFFACVFFASTQDIATDGLSLTIFQRKNVGYSATAQSIGMSLGFFLAHVGFIILDSKDFSNLFRSTPQNYGFVTFADFLFYWALVFLVTTTLVLIFKQENNVELSNVYDERELRVGETYLHLWKILKIPSVQVICVFLLSWHVAFGPMRSVASLKLLDAGIRRDLLALFSTPSLPLHIILPFVLNRYLIGPRPLRCFLIFFVLKIVNCVLYATFIFFITQSMHENQQTMQTWYYWPLIFFSNFDGLAGFIMMIALCSFFARVSDPRFGGVYLTLLNSVNNVGGSWPSTICLWIVESLTIKSCKVGSQCHTILDGFYIEIIACTVIGVLWMIIWGRKQIESLEKMDVCTCMVEQKAVVVEDPLLIADAAE